MIECEDEWHCLFTFHFDRYISIDSTHFGYDFIAAGLILRKWDDCKNKKKVVIQPSYSADLALLHRFCFQK